MVSEGTSARHEQLQRRRAYIRIKIVSDDALAE